MRRRRKAARRGRACAAMLSALMLTVVAQPAAAADRLRVAKSPGYLFAYTPLDVGLATGIFRDKGIDVDEITFDGASKMEQALVAGDVDVALGSPMEMAAAAKGVPTRAIAAIAEPMLEFVLLVPYDSPVASLDDLKGKTFGIATRGSITEWVVRELATVKGWGSDGVKMVGLGAGTAAVTESMRARLVDATVSTSMTGVVLERDKIARVIARVPDYGRPFVAHTMSATDAIMAAHPDMLRRFVSGWFEAVAYMRAHRDEAIRIARAVTGYSAADEATEYDLLMPEVTSDGRFEPETLDRMGRSFVELGILDHAPDMAKLATASFLPKE